MNAGAFTGLSSSARDALVALARAGRAPALPVELEFGGGILALQRSLRLLPGRRLTAWGEFDGRPVVAKLFFVHPKAVREAEREARQLTRLRERGVAVPELVADSGPTPAGRVLILEALPGESAQALYRRACEHGERAAMAARLLSFLAQLHRLGCVQHDAHLGNFLIDGPRTWLLDAGSIALHRRLPGRLRCRNLAALLAQFDPLDTLDSAALLAAYGDEAPAPERFERDLAKARWRRYRHALKKIHRDCTEFATVAAAGLRGMAARPVSGDFRALLEAGIDQTMADGEMLKGGNSSTVCRVQWRGHDWVIKRYNIKSAWHRIKKQFKPSRARRSWRNARWLDLIGLATPQAIGYVERTRGGLLDTAYFVCHYTAGTPLDILPEPALSRACDEMESVFRLMTMLRFNHGDMKANNFLWHEARFWVLDLDAMCIDLPARKAEKLIARDRARWRRNKWFGRDGS